MAAPTLVNRLYPNAATVASGTLVSAGVALAGDLVVVVVCSPGNNNGVPNLTLYDGATPLVTSQAHLLTDTDGTKVVYLFTHRLAATPAGAVAVVINNWPTSGTSRRFCAWLVRPAAGERFADATPARTIPNSSAKTNTGYTNPAWGIPWSAAVGASALGSFVVAVSFQSGTSATTVDFKTGLDGTFEATNSDSFGFTGATNAVQGWGAVYGANDLAATANVGLSANRAGTWEVCAAYFVTVSSAWFGKGYTRMLTKGTAHGVRTRVREGRSRVVVKATGQGLKTTNEKVGEGRPRIVVKATAHGVVGHRRSGRARIIVKASASAVRHWFGQGRARIVTDAWSFGFRQSKVGQGRVRSIVKATGHGVGAHVGQGRVNVVVKATGHGTVEHTGQGRARIITHAIAYGEQPTSERSGRSRIIVKATGHGVRARTRSGRSNLVVKATGFGRHIPKPAQGRARVLIKASAMYSVRVGPPVSVRTTYTRKIGTGVTSGTRQGVGHTQTVIREDIA